MKILLLANGWVGLEVSRYLKSQDEELVGVVLHEPRLCRCGDEILETLQLPAQRVFQANQLRDPHSIKHFTKLAPDIILSVFWAYILKPEFFSIAPQGCINFHPGLLPYNRGKNPNVWPFVEGTPAGVTLHYVDEGIDTGDIVAQREVAIEPTDTGGSLYDKTLHDIVDLFKTVWPQIKQGTAPRIPQDETRATFHLGKQVTELDELDLDKSYSGREWLNRIRARSYADRSYAYFYQGGRKVWVGVRLEYADSPAESTTPIPAERAATSR